MTVTGTTASRMAGNPRGSGYRRADLDWYVEPVEATLALLDVETFVGDIYDPACGCGNIIKACQKRGYTAYGADLIDRGAGQADGIDFLNGPFCRRDNIVCNPPFKLALEFAQAALNQSRYKVAFIQRLAWLEGQKRGAFLESSPLARVWVFKRRICMPPGEKKDLPAKGGFIAYAWFVWEHGHEGPPTIGWI